MRLPNIFRRTMEMATKLNYKVQIPENNTSKEKKFSPKNRTKLSMQAVVGNALGDKQPSAPAQVQPQLPPNNGWGKNN